MHYTIYVAKENSVYEPTWGHEHDEAECGYHAGYLYCRLTLRELADLVRAAVPDAQSLLPRRYQVGSWMPAW